MSIRRRCLAIHKSCVHTSGSVKDASKYDAKEFKSIPKSQCELPLVGSLFSLLRAGGSPYMHEFVEDKHRELGAIFKIKLGSFESIFLNDAREFGKVFANEGKWPRHELPESWLLYNKLKNCKRGLLFMDGEEWGTNRKILSNILLKPDFTNKVSFLRESGILKNIIRGWMDETCRNGEIDKLEEKLYQLSILFMIAYMIGPPLENNFEFFWMKACELAQVVREIFFWSCKLSVIPAKFAYTFNLTYWKNFEYSMHTTIYYAKELIQAMSQCISEDSIGEVGILSDMRKVLPPHAIDRIMTDFIIAAGDTTATALQWTLYLLGLHEDVQNKLWKELHRDNSPYCVYLKNVLKESLRMYPVAMFISRYLAQSTTLAGYNVPKGTLVTMSVYSSSRDCSNFTRANEFDPDRWIRSDGKRVGDVLCSYASLPYAMGVRSCIGRKLAQDQLLSTTAEIISSYKLQVDNPVELRMNMISAPAKPIKLRMTERKKGDC